MNLELISDLWGCYLSRLNRQLQPCDVTVMLDLMKAFENCKPVNWEPGGCFLCAGQPIEIRRKCEHNRASANIVAQETPREEELVRSDASKLSTEECVQISSIAHVLYGCRETHDWMSEDYRLIINAILHPHARSYKELQHLIKLSINI